MKITNLQQITSKLWLLFNQLIWAVNNIFKAPFWDRHFKVGSHRSLKNYFSKADSAPRHVSKACVQDGHFHKTDTNNFFRNFGAWKDCKMLSALIWALHIKTCFLYRPPIVKIQDKVMIPQDNHPEVNFIGLLIGPRWDCHISFKCSAI